MVGCVKFACVRIARRDHETWARRRRQARLACRRLIGQIRFMILGTMYIVRGAPLVFTRCQPVAFSGGFSIYTPGGENVILFQSTLRIYY